MKVLKDVRCVLIGTALFGVVAAGAQMRKSQPVNDSAAQASPSGPVLNTPATDSSAEASPISEAHGGKAGLPAHTTLHVVLTESIDSGNLKNGQVVHGTLQSAELAHRGASTRSGNQFIPKAGTPVVVTVIGTVPAGKLSAVGEISLELVHVGGQSVETNVLTFRGQPGHRDLPDSAPMVGTNAGLPSGTALTFVVRPPPSFAHATPHGGSSSPGSVTQHVSGSKPSNYGQPAGTSAPGSSVDRNGAPVGNGGGTPQPAQNTGQGAAAPNQMTAPSNASPTSTQQPH